jgi:hypothetical protein
MAENRIRSFGRIAGVSQGVNGLDVGASQSDPDLVAANIANGVDILGIVGTHVRSYNYASGTTLVDIGDASGWSKSTSYASWTKVYSFTSPYSGSLLARVRCSRDTGTQGYKWLLDGVELSSSLTTGYALDFNLDATATVSIGGVLELQKYNSGGGTTTVSDLHVYDKVTNPTIYKA